VQSVRYIDEVLQQQDIVLVESVQRGMRTPAFDQGRIVYDPAGSGLSEHGVHHFHGLVLDAYRSLVGLERAERLGNGARGRTMRSPF
jgi:choline monooxygenase